MAQWRGGSAARQRGDVVALRRGGSAVRRRDVILDESSITLLFNAVKEIGLELSGAQLEAFSAFGDLLIARSRYVNLTAITDERGIVIKHFLDSLCVAAYTPGLAAIPSAAGVIDADSGHSAAGVADFDGGHSAAGVADFDGGHSAAGVADFDGGHSTAGVVDSACLLNRRGAGPYSLIDIGAGAGFPGIPLKILFGDKLRVTLIDSVRKKVDFMNHSISILGLNDCDAIHIRAEDAALRDNLRGQFDFATARALAALPRIYDYASPLLRSGGILIAMKGRREAVDRELSMQHNLTNRTERKNTESSASSILPAPIKPSGNIFTPPGWAPPKIIEFILRDTSHGNISNSHNPAAASGGQYERTLCVAEKN